MSHVQKMYWKTRAELSSSLRKLAMSRWCIRDELNYPQWCRRSSWIQQSQKEFQIRSRGESSVRLRHFWTWSSSRLYLRSSVYALWILIQSWTSCDSAIIMDSIQRVSRSSRGHSQDFSHVVRSSDQTEILFSVLSSSTRFAHSRERNVSRHVGIYSRDPYPFIRIIFFPPIKYLGCEKSDLTWSWKAQELEWDPKNIHVNVSCWFCVCTSFSQRDMLCCWSLRFIKGNRCVFILWVSGENTLWHCQCVAMLSVQYHPQTEGS